MQSFTVGFAIGSSFGNFGITKMIEMMAICFSNEAMEASQNEYSQLGIRIV